MFEFPCVLLNVTGYVRISLCFVECNQGFVGICGDLWGFVGMCGDVCVLLVCICVRACVRVCVRDKSSYF
jgi:hypothetical protein